MRTRATILSTANDPNSVSLLFEEHFHSSTSRSDSEHRRYQRTAQRISSGAVCRHLNIAGRVAFFTIFAAYQPFQPKLQHIRLDAGERARAVSSYDSPGHWRDSLASAPTMAKGRTGKLASRQASARSSDRPIGQLLAPVTRKTRSIRIRRTLRQPWRGVSTCRGAGDSAQHAGENQLVQRKDPVPIRDSRQADRIEYCRLPDR